VRTGSPAVAGYRRQIGAGDGRTYYGPQKLHEVLERSTWHIGQHTRQWVMLLGMQESPRSALGESDFADLPMPKQVGRLTQRFLVIASGAKQSRSADRADRIALSLRSSQ